MSPGQGRSAGSNVARIWAAVSLTLPAQGHRAALISTIPELGGLGAAHREGQQILGVLLQTWSPAQSPARAFLLLGKGWTWHQSPQEEQVKLAASSWAHTGWLWHPGWSC